MIVCLGWGSLVWRPKALPVEGSWHPDGPRLPVEFTRVSRYERLTLVITKGAPLVPVLWSRLAVATLDQGMGALARREGVKPPNIPRSIGVWSIRRSSGHAEAKGIGAWARERGIEAVIWTALQPGRPSSRGRALTCQEALAHLRGLKGRRRACAEHYIRQTPAQIKTPYRAAIEKEFGWTPASDEAGSPGR